MSNRRKRQKNSNEKSNNKRSNSKKSEIWFEVFKLILFHGFDHLSDIGMCASINRELYEWAQVNVFHMALMQMNMKCHNCVPCIRHSAAVKIPSRTLLKIRKNIIFSTFYFGPKPLDFDQLDQITWTVIRDNHFFFTMHVGSYSIIEHTNAEQAFRFSYVTFEPLSYVIPTATVKFDDEGNMIYIRIILKLL